MMDGRRASFLNALAVTIPIMIAAHLLPMAQWAALARRAQSIYARLRVGFPMMLNMAHPATGQPRGADNAERAACSVLMR
jgi:hypothetical protein